MEILLIGDFSDNLDEGMKNVAKYIYSYLSKNYDVGTLNVKGIGSEQTIQILKNSSPDVIHYFTGPTFSSFIFLRVLSVRWPKSKIVVSALHPRMASFLERKILRFIARTILRPDVILYQDHRQLFKSIARSTMFFPNGVDTTRFLPATKKEKLVLREKYNIDKDKFVMLHVGHLSEKGKRNLKVFSRLQETNEECQVLIVGSTYLGKDQMQCRNLVKIGCKIIEGYISNIEEIYALSDCYIFPVAWGDSINIPLSVMEAMSCNLPVISIEYPGLTIFEEGDGLYFVKNEDEIIKKSEEVRDMIRNSEIEIHTREKVLPYSWTNLVEKLERLYDQLLET